MPVVLSTAHLLYAKGIIETNKLGGRKAENKLTYIRFKLTPMQLLQQRKIFDKAMEWNSD